ncbi:hypothetical protein OJAV_G00110600 [Oryzias javanicus]|uniref:Uncharacterized protein n=1 Tax=Oryzias javanicus TaxID=123683 RepID=A0A3S2P4Z7_ORYJA|nr:hypothetical protein OJAV_G00110600 [Oryzias javanicus]
MTGTGGAAPPTAVLGVGIDGVWQRRAAGSSKFSVLSYPHHLPAVVESKVPLKLPSLVTAGKGPRRRSCTARLSLSEPSLLAPCESIQLEGFSSFHRLSVLQNQHPPLSTLPMKSSTRLSCQTFHLSGAQNHQKKQLPHSSLQPAFIHFSKAIRPSVRPQAVRRHSHYPALSSEAGRSDLLTSAGLHGSPSSWEEPLSVVGKPCLLRCSQRAARSQLHIFLPSEAKAEEVDRESVDEGFMDELDIKIGSLKLQEEPAKTVTSPS